MSDNDRPSIGRIEAAGGVRSPAVLVVDDERLLLETAARVLKNGGYDTYTACDGREAVAMLANQAFDVIVSDIRMPEMDGIQLLRAVRERDEDVPVVLMTASPDLATAMEAVALGALQYFVKPFDVVELRTVVARAVSPRANGASQKGGARPIERGGSRRGRSHGARGLVLACRRNLVDGVPAHRPRGRRITLRL